MSRDASSAETPPRGLSRRDFLRRSGQVAGGLLGAAVVGVGIKSVIDIWGISGQITQETADFRKTMKGEVSSPLDTDLKIAVKNQFGFEIPESEIATFSIRVTTPTGHDESEFAILPQEGTWPNNHRVFIRNNNNLVELHPWVVSDPRDKTQIGILYDILPEDSDLTFYADSPVKDEGCLAFKYTRADENQDYAVSRFSYSPPIKGLVKLREGKDIGGFVDLDYTPIPQAAKTLFHPPTK